MNIDMHGRRVESIWWEPSFEERGYIKSDEFTYLKFSATHHGDHDQFWVVEYEDNGSYPKEVARYNPRYLTTIVWA